jgi:hypothetical protein
MGRPQTVHRRFPRLQAAHPLFVEIFDDRAAGVFARTEVIAEGGCMFTSTDSFGFRSLMRLFISTGGRIVNADARVAYERRRRDGRYEVGVEFLRVSPVDRAHLRALVDSQLTVDH